MKASVLPEPVCATEMTSRPPIAIGTEVPCWYTWVDDSSELLGTAALTYAVKLSEGTPEGATGGMRTLVAVLALTLILLWTCALCYGCVLCESWRSAYVSRMDRRTRGSHLRSPPG